MTQAFTSPITSRLKGGLFNPLEFNPYLLFDAQTSMLGELEAPTLDLDASDESTLDVITATRAGVATYTDLHGVIKTASADTVRVDWSLGYPAMLIEPSATNLIDYSENSGAWSKIDVTVTPNTTIAPDGNLTASTAVANGSSPQVARGGNYVTSGLDYTMSVFAKADTDALIQLDVSNAIFGPVNATFNVRTGELTDGDETKVSVEDFNDGWKRFSFTATCTTTGTSNFLIRLQNTEPVQLWGFQFEQGSVATSYIPTSGSAVTRNADNLVIDGTAFSDFYNDSEGTIYCEFVYDFDPAYEYLYVIKESPTDEIRTQLTVGDDIRTRYTVANSHIAVSPNGTVRGSLNRHAYSYKTDNFRASINGSVDAEVLTGTASLSPSSIKFGQRSGVLETTKFKRFIYWPTSSDSL